MACRFLIKIVLLYGLLCGSSSLLASEYRHVGSSNAVLVLGDSISAAYGIDKRDGWVALLEKRLASQCPNINIINASVSGETTTGGLARLPALLAVHQPSLLVIELGGNDGLRGLSPRQMLKNLQQMIALGEGAGAQVAVLGILMPPNLGAAYVRLFEQAMAEVAEHESVLFQTFFLQGVAGQADLIQVDGLHPTAAAQPRLLNNAWQLLEKPLRGLCQTSTR
ncbi:MAG: arylesterase [Porticoccaceae bacterium]|nr:arylesterase [Porticoccaceae bacterium]